jgi:hypothetical protein
VKASLIGVALLAVTLGCQSLNEPIYIASPAPLDVVGVDAAGNPNRVKGSVVLRFRRPSATEQQTLNDDTRRLGFEVPWLKRSRIHLEVLYTVRNVDSVDGVFSVGVDGASEFVKYDEDVVAAAFVSAGEKPVLVPLIAPTPRSLGPNQVYQGTVREDDFVEASLDLDAMGRWMAPFAAVLINRSDVNPIGLDMVPANAVIPALQEIDLTLVSATHMTCDFIVRVRDDDDQLLHESADRLFVPTPTVFTPTIM